MTLNTVIKNEASCKLTEKRSIFISYLKKVNNKEEAINFIDNIKSKHHDAKHNVYAYSLDDAKTLKYSDDGEPSKTAGAPILNLLSKNNLTDVVIVVTRYFGGILLGTGGLVRAYSECAKLALDEAGIIEKIPYIKANLTCTYENYEKIKNLINYHNGEILETLFKENILIKFHINEDSSNEFESKLNDITLGNSNLKYI